MEIECSGPIDLKTVDSKYKLLFECALDMVFLVDVSGKIIDANDTAIKEYGYARDELLSMNIRDIRTPSERQFAANQLREAFEKGAIYETVHQRKNGSAFPVEIGCRGLIVDDDQLIIAIVRDITKRKEEEQRIRYIASFPELNPNPILEIDEHGVVTYHNPAAKRLFPDLAAKGIDHPMLRGLIAGRDYQKVMGNRCELIREAQVDGTFYHQNIQYLPDGKVRVYSVDISDRKSIEQALMESEQKCWTIFNWTFEFIGLLAPDGSLLEVNNAALQFIGEQESDVLGMPFWETPWWSHSRELQQKLRSEIEKAAEGNFVRFEATHRAVDGSLHYIDVSIKPFYSESGQVIRLIVEGRDITDRIKAEKALRKSQFILSKSQEVAHVGNWAWNVLTGEINMSDEGFRIFGYRPQEFVPTLGWLVSRVHHDDVEYVSGKFASIIRDGWLGSFDYRILLPDDRQRYLNAIADKIVLDKAGKPIWVYGINQDISERKQAEEALRESEKNFRALAESSAAAIVVYQDERVVSVNPAAELITGYPKDELLKMRLVDLIHPDFKGVVLKRAISRQRGEPEPYLYEIEIVTRGGGVKWVLVSTGLMMYRGKPAGVVTAQDITDLKLVEVELIKSKRQSELYLDLMGHDITNMNQALIGYLEMIELMRESGEIDKALIDNSIELINRSSRMISNLKKLTQIQAGEVVRKDVDMCKMLATVIARYSNVPGRDINIRYLRAEGCLVRAGDQLEDVFDNLLDNAIRYSTGRVTIDVSKDLATENGGLYYRVSVADRGPGIPDDMKRKILMTSPETVDKMQRRGLGLYLVRTLVDYYQGKVWVEDRVPGDYTKGARFVVMLPAAGK